VLLDAFAVAEEMREKHPQHFATLTRVPATFEKAHPMELVQFQKIVCSCSLNLFRGSNASCSEDPHVQSLCTVIIPTSFYEELCSTRILPIM